MIFPITELLSEAESQRWITYYFHPRGLRCPRCKTSVYEARQFRHSQRGLVDYGCTHCQGVYNYSGTGVYQKVGELGRQFHFLLVLLHTGIPPLECLPEFIVEHARTHL